MKTVRISLILIAIFTLCGDAFAQPLGKIVPNPKAVRLRELWRMEGGNGLSNVGHSSGSLGIGPNGLGMWTVFVNDRGVGKWKIFHGNKGELSTLAVQSVDSLGSTALAPVVGRFWGGERLGVGLFRIIPRTVDGSSWFERILVIYEMKDGVLSDAPVVEIDLTAVNGICLADISAADMDGDGADEIIAATGCSYPEVRIYKGGVGFDGKQPDKVITSNRKLIASGSIKLSISDLDGDGRLDLLMSTDLNDERYTLFFYLSRNGSFWDWDRPHKIRVLTGPPAYPVRSPEPVAWSKALDLNGDRVGDIYGFVGTGDTAGVYIWLSDPGVDFASRPLDGSDYDVYIPATGYVQRPWLVGPLNDSLERYDMLGLILDEEGGAMHFYSGGPEGPDGTYDAWAGEGEGGVFLRTSPLPDVNGDGWPDMLTSYFGWKSERGIAIVYAGGPEIPLEHTSDVKKITVDEENNGLYVWPNPTDDELNIAWKGGLKSMPHRLEIFDVRGSLVAEGNVEPEIGAARWECSGVGAGIYILVGYDENGQRISSLTFVVK